MPVVSLEKLKHAVIDGSVGAITVDTSVVERYQFGFESGVLAKLAQFSHAEADHIVLDIVLHEIRSHLRSEADLVRSQVKNALKPLGNSWGIEKTDREAALTLLFGEQSGQVRTEKRLQAFLQDSSAVVLTCSDLVSLPDILSRFIETKAPFGNTEGKKHEFPDAVALLALEAWAVKNDKAVIAVSRDTDWKRYCVDSPRVYFIDDLAQALSAFQAGADDASLLLGRLLAEGKVPNLDEIILEAIRFQSDKIDIDMEASANWYYEAELYDIEVSSDSSMADQVKEFDVVEFEDNVLVIQTSLALDVTAHFSVNFQAWDGIDREYLSAGSASIHQTERMDLEVILTMAFSNGTAAIDSVELLPAGTTMYFGEIEPDWMNDRGGPDDDEPSE
jgi:PIN domain